jgi:hypothetical protein
MLVKLLLLARLVAYMALVYLAFGWLVEVLSKKPGSKLKAFARLLCSPLVKPAAAAHAPGTPYRTVLIRTLLAIAGLWVILIVVSELALRR